MSALFDLSFSSFISSKLIKVLYVLSIVGAGLMALVLITSAFSVGAGTGLFTLLVVSPLVFLATVIYARILMELMIVLFRISENIQTLVDEK